MMKTELKTTEQTHTPVITISETLASYHTRCSEHHRELSRKLLSQQNYRDSAHQDDLAAIHGQAAHLIASEIPSLVEQVEELRAALEGVIRVADRATDVFDAARAALAKGGCK